MAKSQIKEYDIFFWLKREQCLGVVLFFYINGVESSINGIESSINGVESSINGIYPPIISFITAIPMCLSNALTYYKQTFTPIIQTN